MSQIDTLCYILNFLETLQDDQESLCFVKKVGRYRFAQTGPFSVILEHYNQTYRRQVIRYFFSSTPLASLLIL